MSPRQVFGDFVARHVLQIIGGAFLFGGAWFVLHGQVAQKADKTTVEAMARDVRDIKTLVCRQWPDDSQCAGLPGVTSRSRSVP